jgi:peptidoglycan biosynthesis protein MviN/MurJ (putative lipid II flippase)
MKLNFSLGLTAVGQLALQLGFQLLVLRLVGVGETTDAFLAAQGVPAVLLAVLMVSLQSVWQPRLAVLHKERSSWIDAQRIAHGQALIVLWVPAVLLWVTRPAWLPALLPGFSAEQLLLASDLSLPLFFSGAVNGHVAVLTTALRARDEFLFPELVVLTSHVFACVMIYALVPEFGVIAAAWVLALRAVLTAGVLFFRAGGPVAAPLRAVGAPVIWGQMWPLTTGSSIYKTGPLVDRFWSSQAGPGAITALSLSQNSIGALATVAERAICTPVAPRFARLVASAEFVELRALYRRTVGRVAITVSLCLMMIVVSRPLWPVVLEFIIGVSAGLATQIWTLCILLAGYLFVAVAGTTMVAVFYAMGDTKTPVLIGVGGFLLGVLLKSVAFLEFGINGLVAATSAYYLINMVGFVFFLEKAIDRASGRSA